MIMPISSELKSKAAIKRNIPVVPILIDYTVMPSAAELPETLASLAFRNAAELRAGRDLDHHLELIVNGLHLNTESTECNAALLLDYLTLRSMVTPVMQANE